MFYNEVYTEYLQSRRTLNQVALPTLRKRGFFMPAIWQTLIMPVLL